MLRLKPSQLHIGTTLPWDVYDLSGKLLLRKGFVIARDETVDLLLERGMYVDPADYAAYLKAEGGGRDYYNPMSSWHDVQLQLGVLFKEPPRDGTLQDELEELADQVEELCDKDPEFAIAAISLLEFKRYPVAHSLHTAVITSLVAKRAGMSDLDRFVATCAALSMNIAMADLQQQLFSQRGTLSPEQRQAIQDHPAGSAKLLMACGVQHDEWLRAVLEHHENAEGGGYPRRTKQPSALALLIHTADVFTAKVSPRQHRRPLMPSAATKQVFTSLGRSGNNPFPALLVKEIGIYPPGSLVKLANSEIGVVFKSGEKATCPTVVVLIDAKGLTQRDRCERDTAISKEFQIVTVLPRDTSMVGVDFKAVWCLGD